jgi:hypothetical protein
VGSRGWARKGVAAGIVGSQDRVYKKMNSCSISKQINESTHFKIFPQVNLMFNILQNPNSQHMINGTLPISAQLSPNVFLLVSESCGFVKLFQMVSLK